MKKEFHHIGIPSSKQRPGETYLAAGKLYVTDVTASENAIEWLRFEADSPMPQQLKTTAHVAYKVDNVEKAIAGKQVLIPPFSPMMGVKVAFVLEDEAPIEFLQIGF